MTKTRRETDSMGDVRVPENKYWGAQTQRSVENFPIGGQRFQPAFIKALALVKKAAARANLDLGELKPEHCQLIEQVCDEIIAGNLDDHFPLVVWQTGSGTHTNMNVNEVIANRAAEIAGTPMGKKSPIHPNDHVNMSQSSNDIFPTAMHIAALSELQFRLLPAIRNLAQGIETKSVEFSRLVKTGRTHLMDAAPLTLGQEFSAFTAQLTFAEKAIAQTITGLCSIAAGGTAVGTGLNAPAGFSKKIADHLSNMLQMNIQTADNKFAAIAAHDAVVHASSCLKLLATTLMKIANDIRLLGSGPRCGLGELLLPANEPGSSIMPGKVNPSQCESLTMVAARVIGNDTTVTIAGCGGQLQLNACKPVMIYALLESTALLADGCSSFLKRCIEGMKADESRLKDNVARSLMLATALNPILGYDRVAAVVKVAISENISLRDVVLREKLLTGEEFDNAVRPEQMV